jgi:hypothetical protein
MTHRPGDGGSKDLWNVGKLLPDFTALQSRRQPSSYSPPWEPQFLDFCCIAVLYQVPTQINRKKHIHVPSEIWTHCWHPGESKTTWSPWLAVFTFYGVKWRKVSGLGFWRICHCVTLFLKEEMAENQCFKSTIVTRSRITEYTDNILI